MNVLVDTCVWSTALRCRKGSPRSVIVDELEELIREGRVETIGAIRQEVLSGIRSHEQFLRLRDSLRAFPDIDTTSEDYERAADLFNLCRSKGIQGSNTDFLICAVAEQRGLSIFTTDDDFSGYAKYAQIAFHEVRDQ